MVLVRRLKKAVSEASGMRYSRADPLGKCISGDRWAGLGNSRIR